MEFLIPLLIGGVAAAGASAIGKPKKPDISVVQQPNPVAQPEEAEKKKRTELDETLRRRGAGYNILTSETGLPDLGTTKKRTATGGY